MTAPLVASYCTTFLKPEMLHIYRQVTNLRRWRTIVIAREVLNKERFPMPAGSIVLLPKPRTNPLRRAWLKYACRAPALIYRGECDVLSKVLAQNNADLLHIYFGHTAVHLLPFVLRWRRPVVISFHGMDARSRPDDPAYDKNLAAAFQAARLILARSQALAARLEELGCPRQKIRLNRTGIPMDAFPYVHREVPPRSGAWRIVQACRLIEKKGLFVSLRAFALFQKTHPHARLTIAGDGPLRAQLAEEASLLGISGVVDFVGFLDQTALLDLYGRSHIFVHPSETTSSGDREGIPNSMLEAMATGLPVVSTYHSGIPEAVVHGASGYLAAEQDHKAVYDGLLKLTASSTHWHALSAEASRSVREKFELTRQIAVLEDCYTEALPTM